MAVLSRTILGLILAENGETYPNGWTFEASGSLTAQGSKINLAHSGSGSFQLETLNSWPVAGYARLYKSVNLLTGLNRVTRLLRGPGYVASVTDDFPGSSPDATKWGWGGAPTVSNSILSVGAGVNVGLLNAFAPPASTYYDTFFRCQADGGIVAYVTCYNGLNGYVQVLFNWDGLGHVKMQTHTSPATTTTDCGVIPTGYHNYRVKFAAGPVATLYIDGVQVGTCSDSSVPAVDSTGPYNLGLGSGAGNFLLDAFGYVTGANIWKASYAIGSQTIFDQDVQTEARSLDNGFFDSGWIAITPTGTQTVELKLRNASAGADPRSAQCTWDDLIIMLDKVVTIKGLTNGQKVELYDTGGTLKNTVTKVAGSDPTIDVSGYISTASGWAGYFKVYNSDGITLNFTSGTDFVWGGDIYQWSGKTSVIYAPTGSIRVYALGSLNQPHSTTLTFRMKDQTTDLPISGVLITFSASIGTVNPASALTDINGYASTLLQSALNHGWAIVQGNWGGDGTVSPSTGYVEVAVYDAADVGDASKGFQLFVHGASYPFKTGNYDRSTLLEPRQFTVELPQIYAAIDGPLEVIVYRRGVKDFVGRITSIKRTILNTMILNGVSNHWKLGRRVNALALTQSYNADPATILTDLLTRYPCGITIGTIATFGNPLPFVFNYDSLRLCIQRIMDATGWKVRLNLDDSLDFNSAFGNVRAVTFQTGVQNVILERETDYLDLITRSLLIGTPSTLISDKNDVTQAAGYGLVEKVTFDKNVTVQSTLDFENQNILNNLKAPIDRITSAFVDLQYAAGSYDLFDYVTVVDSLTGLSGLYQLVEVKRDMLDTGYIEPVLSTAPIEFASLLASQSRIVKDLAVH